MKEEDFGKFQEVTLGPVKIKDGLFMGDELAAKDIQFIISNKVTHVVNTVSHKIPNLWENFGIHYLSVGWSQKQTNIFDKKNNALNAIFNFIEESEKKGESCLVHSVNGKSRSFTVIVAYLMRKYQWSLSKCLQFIDSRKENLQIRLNYLSELEVLEKRIKKAHSLNSNWDISNSQQEKVLNNTYKNSLSSKQDNQINYLEKVKKVKRIQWKDEPQIIQHHEEAPPSLQLKNKINVKPILKGKGEEHEQYQFYNETAIKRPKQGIESNTLNKLLFESTQKKKGRNYDKETSQKKNDITPPKQTRRSTTEVRARSLETQERQNSEQSRDGPNKKKLQHYKQVLACYHASGSSDSRFHKFCNFEEQKDLNQNASRHFEYSEQSKTYSLDKEQKVEKKTLTIKTKKVITISSSSRRNRKERQSPLPSNKSEKSKTGKKI